VAGANLISREGEICSGRVQKLLLLLIFKFFSSPTLLHLAYFEVHIHAQLIAVRRSDQLGNFNLDLDCLRLQAANPSKPAAATKPGTYLPVRKRKGSCSAQLCNASSRAQNNKTAIAILVCYTMSPTSSSGSVRFTGAW
jgi:hypothetical protein